MTTGPLLDTDTPTAVVPPPPPSTVVDEADDDALLEAPLPPLTHRRRLGPLTVVLGLTLAVAGGFVGGIVLEHRHDDAVAADTAAANPFAALAAARGGTGSGPGGTGSGGGGGRAGRSSQTALSAGASGGAGQAGQAGAVKLVDGNKLYVAMPDGSIATYTVENDTQIARTVAAGTDALTPGQTVVVTPSGSPDADGVAKAGVITVAPTGGR